MIVVTLLKNSDDGPSHSIPEAHRDSIRIKSEGATSSVVMSVKKAFSMVLIWYDEKRENLHHVGLCALSAMVQFDH